MDSTNQQRLPPNAHARRDVFQARLPLQEMVKLNKGSFFIITETQFENRREYHVGTGHRMVIQTYGRAEGKVLVNMGVPVEQTGKLSDDNREDANGMETK